MNITFVALVRDRKHVLRFGNMASARTGSKFDLRLRQATLFHSLAAFSKQLFWRIFHAFTSLEVSHMQQTNHGS